MLGEGVYPFFCNGRIWTGCDDACCQNLCVRAWVFLFWTSNNSIALTSCSFSSHFILRKRTFTRGQLFLNWCFSTVAPCAIRSQSSCSVHGALLYSCTVHVSFIACHFPKYCGFRMRRMLFIYLNLPHALNNLDQELSWEEHVKIKQRLWLHKGGRQALGL